MPEVIADPNAGGRPVPVRQPASPAPCRAFIARSRFGDQEAGRLAKSYRDRPT